MNRPTPLLLFVLGPSGVGKSTVGEWSALDLDLLHIEVDQWLNGDGIDAAEIRKEWDEYFYAGSAGPLAASLRSSAAKAVRSGTVVTFPGNLVLLAKQLDAARKEGIVIVLLYGSETECRNAFLSREATTRRGLGVDHWNTQNRDAYRHFKSPNYEAFRVWAFESGERRSRSAIVEDLRKRLERAG